MTLQFQSEKPTLCISHQVSALVLMVRLNTAGFGARILNGELDEMSAPVQSFQ